MRRLHNSLCNKHLAEGYHSVYFGSFCTDCNERYKLEHPEEFNVKERYFCDVCNDNFEGEPGKHVNDVHGEEYHSSESMIDFEERHISEVD